MPVVGDSMAGGKSSRDEMKKLEEDALARRRRRAKEEEEEIEEEEEEEEEVEEEDLDDEDIEDLDDEDIDDLDDEDIDDLEDEDIEDEDEEEDLEDEEEDLEDEEEDLEDDDEEEEEEDDEEEDEDEEEEEKRGKTRRRRSKLAADAAAVGAGKQVGDIGAARKAAPKFSRADTDKSLHPTSILQVAGGMKTEKADGLKGSAAGKNKAPAISLGREVDYKDAKAPKEEKVTNIETRTARPGSGAGSATARAKRDTKQSAAGSRRRGATGSLPKMIAWTVCGLMALACLGLGGYVFYQRFIMEPIKPKVAEVRKQLDVDIVKVAAEAQKIWSEQDAKKEGERDPEQYEKAAQAWEKAADLIAEARKQFADDKEYGGWDEQAAEYNRHARDARNYAFRLQMQRKRNGQPNRDANNGEETAPKGPDASKKSTHMASSEIAMPVRTENVDGKQETQKSDLGALLRNLDNRPGEIEAIEAFDAGNLK